MEHRKGVDELVSVARLCGINNSRLHKLLGVSRSTLGNWMETGRVSNSSVPRVNTATLALRGALQAEDLPAGAFDDVRAIFKRHYAAACNSK